MCEERAAIVRICFLILLMVGLGLVFFGCFVEPALPFFAMDRVLSPAELHDSTTYDATLALLKRAEGNRWLLWCIAGVVVAATSSVGLWTVREMSKHE